MSEYYFNFDNSSSGIGTSTDPANSSQLNDFLLHNIDLDGTSAVNDDILRIKGTESDVDVFDGAKIYYTARSWESGEPYVLSSSDGNVKDFDSNNRIDKAGTLANDLYYQNKYYNLIINGSRLSTIGMPLSGTYDFNNCWFYNDFNIANNLDYNITFNACNFLSGSSILTEYNNNSATYNQDNIVIYNDCIFDNYEITDDGKNYGNISANNCYFTDTDFASISSDISATILSGSTDFSTCIFNWSPSANDFFEFDNLNINKTDLNSKYYGIPITSAITSADGFYNTTRTGPGAFYFGDLKGHIGAFYFGETTGKPVSLDLTLTLNDGSASIGENITISPKALNIFTGFFDVEAVKAYSDISVDFTGIPRAGTSPLVVDFTADVNLLGKKFVDYKVSEYKWYFDAGRDLTTSASTTTNTTSHTFTGYSGKKFDIKLQVVLESK